MVKNIRIGLLMPDSRWMGGVIYLDNLMKSTIFLTPEQQQNIELHLIVSSHSSRSGLDERLKSLVEKVIIEKSLNQELLLNRVFFKIEKNIPLVSDRRLSDLVIREKLDFLYPITESNFFIANNLSCAWTSWIPDFQHKYLPSFFTKQAIEIRDRIYQQMSQESPGIVFSSKVALNDFKKFYPESKAKTSVLNFRTVPDEEWFQSDTTYVQKKYDLPEKFFLISNQFWIHKNHKLVIEALCKLKKNNTYPVIVCTGKLHDNRFPNYSQEILQLIQDNDLEKQIILLGLIPRADQIQLMRQAIAVIQPSLFEGWSTVVEDARALGKILILSDIAVHLEQNPPNSYFFQQTSAEELAENMNFLWQELIPGPDLAEEKTARTINKSQCQTYAAEFCQIAYTAIASSNV